MGKFALSMVRKFVKMNKAMLSFANNLYIIIALIYAFVAL